jgi:predicted O-linked N-acetylglucosamine transferase (SPINDLY family)
MATLFEELTRAVHLHQAGNLDEAERIYRQILQGNPGEPNALYLLGMLAHQRGQHQAALELLGRAAVLLPRVEELRTSLAAVYLGQADALVQQRKWDEALASYDEALRLRPACPEAHNNRGYVLQQLGRPADAEASYRAALALAPDSADLLNHLGAALADQGRHEQAIASYQEAVRREAALVEARYNLAQSLAVLGRHDEALAELEQVVLSKPDFAEALANLGNLYKDQGRIEEAIACYHRAATVRPELLGIQSNLLDTLRYAADYDPETVFVEHRRRGVLFGPADAKYQPLQPIDRSSGRRLRIGYLTAGFSQTGLGRYTAAVAGAHDRGQVEVFCYPQMPRPDAMTEHIQRLADHWRPVAHLSDDHAADLIRQERIDVLVDLSGHTGNNRLGVFARKPAPIQVTHFGYCDSTGLPAMDYRLTDRHCDPPGQTERWHVEQLVWLPQVQWCYVPACRLEVSPLPARRAGQVTFAAFSKLAKITSPMLTLWAQILEALPEARLLVVAGAGSAGDERLRKAFSQHEIAPERVQLVQRQSHEAYYLLYHEVDIGLDVYPFSGCFITADSLFMGVPVVSRAGSSAITRQGLALLSQVGLEDLVATTPENYVELAVGLAHDLPRLRALRAGLRNQLERSPLMDVTGFTRSLEAAYRTIWGRFCKS